MDDLKIGNLRFHRVGERVEVWWTLVSGDRLIAYLDHDSLLQVHNYVEWHAYDLSVKS